jgi:autotransporter-associated beta strand protein
MKDSFTVLSSLQTETLPLNNKEQLLTHSPRDEKADNQILSGSRVNTKPIPAIKFLHRHAGSAPFYKVMFLLLAFVMVRGLLIAQTTVTYVMQDANFPTQFNDGGDFFNNGGAELGMWANSGNKKTVGWRTFKTAGDNTGSNRALQVGDIFKITISATRAFGEIGFSLNAGGTQGSSYLNNVSGSRLYCSTVNYAAWKVNGTSSLSYVPIQSTAKDYIFTIRITSSTTADVFLTVDGTDYRAYNLTMNGSGNIDAFSIYGADMWDGDSNDDAYWKQTSTVTNSKRVELGYYLTAGTYTPGIISNGLDAASTSTPSVNDVFVGGDAGSMVALNQTNTYSGSTTVNSNGRLELQNTAALGSTSGVTVQNNAALSLYFASGTNTYNTYATTLNGAGVSGANGALRSTGGNNTWPGGITLASSSRINADASGAAGSLALSGAVTLASNTLTIGGGTSGVTISGKISGAGVLAKDGTNTLSLSNATNDYSGGTVLTAGTISLANNAVLGSGDFTFGSGSTTSTLDITDNTSRSGIIKVVEASTAGVINVASGKTFTLNGAITSTGTNAATKFGKSGPGTFIVNANGSTYPGQIQIGDGTVVVQNNGGLGTNISTTNRGIDLGLNVGDVSTTNNVVLQAITGITVPQSIYVATNATSGNATRTISLNGTGSATFSNEIYLNGNLTASGGSGIVTLSGALINTGGLIVNGGTVVLSGTNTYTGATTVSAGTLEIQGDLASSSITVASGAKLVINGSNVDINALTINPGGIVEINAGKSLTVNGTLTNSATSSGLVIKSDATGTGSLIEHSGVAATVQRYIMNDFKWHFLSSPVSSQAIWPEFAPTPTGTPLIFAGGPTYGWDFYYYNPKVPSTGLYWVNLRKTGGAYNNETEDVASDAAGFGTTTPTFTVGKGYLVAYNTTPFLATHTFIGNLNYGMVTRAIVSSPNAYNLVGNPYPSSIDWKAATGWTRSNLISNSGGYDYWIYNDVVHNYGTYNSATVSSEGTNSVTRYIAPGQAFFVQASTSGDLVMTDAVRIHSAQSWLKNTETEISCFRLSITNSVNPYSDEMIVEFNAGFTGGGSDKFWSFDAESPEIYSVKDGNNYSIDRYSALEDNMTVNIAAKTGVSATYTITAVNMADFSLSDYVWLKDKKTGIKTNLKLTPAYSFEGSPGDDRNRFQLIFGAPNGTEEDPADGFTVFSSEGSIFVKADNARAAYSLLVTNMPGQIIKRVKLMGNDIKCLDQKFVRGVYIVTIYSEGNMFSKKVVIM